MEIKIENQKTKKFDTDSVGGKVANNMEEHVMRQFANSLRKVLLPLESEIDNERAEITYVYEDKGNFVRVRNVSSELKDKIDTILKSSNDWQRPSE